MSFMSPFSKSANLNVSNSYASITRETTADSKYLKVKSIIAVSPSN